MKQAVILHAKLSGLAGKNFTPIIICSPADSDLTFIPGVINFVLDHSFIPQKPKHLKAVDNLRKTRSEKQLFNLFGGKKLISEICSSPGLDLEFKLVERTFLAALSEIRQVFVPK